MSETDPLWISGGTGLVGGRLLRGWCAEGRRARIVTRRPESERQRDGIELLGWDGLAVDPAGVANTRGVVHLAGEPIFGGLPTAARRDRIWRSRVDSTRSLVDAIAGLPMEARPRVLVCASAVGYYGDRGEEPLEESAAPGSGFLAELCRAWEAEAARAVEAGLRVVSLRIGVVLAREGGALSMLAPLFRLGLGGPVGDGRQWFPWVHVNDLVELLRRALDDERLAGPVNAVAPNPVRNEEFTRALAHRLQRPAWLRVPAFALRAALGELAGELLGSRRVRPARALEAGFGFAHERVETALAAELG